MQSRTQVDEFNDRTLNINVKGILFAIRASTPLMKEQKYGRIVNVSSKTGKNGDSSTVLRAHFQEECNP